MSNRNRTIGTQTSFGRLRMFDSSVVITSMRQNSHRPQQHKAQSPVGEKHGANRGTGVVNVHLIAPSCGSCSSNEEAHHRDLPRLGCAAYCRDDGDCAVAGVREDHRTIPGIGRDLEGCVADTGDRLHRPAVD
jgi:hypothetical protein